MPITRTQISIAVATGLLLLAVLPINIHFWGIPYFDKFAHIAANAVVVLVLSGFISIRKAVLTTFLLFFLAESIQFFLPNRDADPYDALANGIGAGVGWLIYCLTPNTK